MDFNGDLYFFNNQKDLGCVGSFDEFDVISEKLKENAARDNAFWPIFWEKYQSIGKIYSENSWGEEFFSFGSLAQSI